MVVYLSYISEVILYGSEAWCLKESKIGILRRTERSMVSTMCGMQLKNRERDGNLVLMLGLNEAVNQLAMAYSVRWYGHVL